MCDDDLKSCPMNQSPSDILKASNETVSVSIATSDWLCGVWYSPGPLNGISSRDVDAPRQEFVVFSALCYVLPKILSLWFCTRNLVFPVITPVTSTFDADASADDSSHS